MFIDHYFFLSVFLLKCVSLVVAFRCGKRSQIEENDCFLGANLLNIAKMGGGLTLNKLNAAFFLGFHPLLKGFCLA